MKQPKVVYWSWRRTWPQFAALGILIAATWGFLPPQEKPVAFILGPLIYLFYSLGSRLLIPFSHRRGMVALARKDQETAISQFRASYEFFSRHAWLDEFRSFVMLTPSNWSYREMALLNIATSYAQQGKIGQAKETYERVTREFPGNEFAEAALRLFEAVPNSDDAKNSDSLDTGE